MVNSDSLAQWPLCNGLRKIRGLLDQLQVSVVHVFREVNSIADKMVGLQLHHDQVFTVLNHLPISVRASLQLDYLGLPSIHSKFVRE